MFWRSVGWQPYPIAIHNGKVIIRVFLNCDMQVSLNKIMGKYQANFLIFLSLFCAVSIVYLVGV